MRVLLLHNRYRDRGGEERFVESLHELLLARGIEARTLYRDSREVGRFKAGSSILRAGSRPDLVVEQVADFRPEVVHVHNINPLLGYRALAALRSRLEEKPRVVMHLHNFRLFCAIGTAFRDGQPCFRCRGRRTWPAVRYNCRGSVAESPVYALSLSLYQSRLIECVDRFIVPSNFAAAKLAQFGLAENRITVVASPAPEDALVDSSQADRGQYALYAGRLSEEKGVETAIAAAAAAGTRLLVAGSGPLLEQLRAADYGDKVELLGSVSGERLKELRVRAAVALIPSRGPEVFPLAGLEAMAAGLPLVAADSGGLPEMCGDEQIVAAQDSGQWAARLTQLIDSPQRRRQLGEHNLARVRSEFSSDRFLERITAIYEDK